jgi:hypothetical protein
MNEIGRPPLDPDVFEDLDSHLHTIETNYWKAIQDLQATKSIAFMTGLLAQPTPPRLPIKLRKTLVDYATALFCAEANEYPNDARLGHWLKGLAERTAQRVNGAVAYLEKRAIFGGLDHHGLTRFEMCEIVDEATRELMQSYLGEVVAETPLLAQTVDIPHEDSRNSLPNDPQSWSPLVQQYEAYKQIKELRSGPHERIPEDLVRRAVAEQHGIKPEEVTSEQIRFEVAALLPRYPAITLILSGPTPEPILQPDISRVETVNAPSGTRLLSTIECPSAARKMEAYLSANGIGLTDFSSRAGTTDRTLRNFRKTGKIRRNLFAGIAKAMGITSATASRGELGVDRNTIMRLLVLAGGRCEKLLRGTIRGLTVHDVEADVHKALRVTPAMEAGITDHIWTIAELLG